MKAGFSTSVVLHILILGAGLVSLSAPKTLEVADVEALPVDIVPIEEITQIQKGEKQAPVAEKPAPKPTEKPAEVPDAQTIGDNKVDLNEVPLPAERPRDVKTAAAVEPTPKPEPKPLPVPKPEPKVEQKPEPAPVPATEVKPQPVPKQEVTPDPVAEAIETASAVAAADPVLPNDVPVPTERPTPQAATAKTPERQDSEKPAQKKVAQAKTEEKSVEDEVAALLNQEKAKGGGAKRSTKEAALGGKKTTGGSPLSQNEMDALRGQIQKCWNIPSGALDPSELRVSIQFKLDRSGNVDGSPEIVSGGGSTGIARTSAEAARRAVMRCAPYNLPAEKYDAWADVLVNFDPVDMF
jgi:colicin import membrane protein